MGTLLALFGGSSVKWILMAIGALILVSSAVYVTHKVDLSSYEALELKYAAAQTEAITEAKNKQAAEDKVVLDSALKQSKAQQTILTKKLNAQNEVLKHVTNNSNIITFGLSRVWDAFILGVNPDTLKLPTGKLDGDPAPIDSITLANSIIGNYSSCQANADELIGLQDYIKEILAVTNQTK